MKKKVGLILTLTLSMLLVAGGSAQASYSTGTCDFTPCGGKELIYISDVIYKDGTYHAAKATCSSCGRAYWGNEEEHTFTTTGISVSPTCTESGTKDLKCSKCGYETTGTLGAIGHSYGAWTVQNPATCTTEGTMVRVCANDNDHVEYDTIAIDSTAHNYGAWTTVSEPTCVTDGQEQRVCSYNGSHIETQSIPASGSHDLGDWYKLNETTHERACKRTGCTYKETANHVQATVATCTAARTCSVCGSSYGSVDPNNHNYGSWYKLNETQHEKACSRCGNKVQENHVGGTATCTEAALCTTCSNRYGNVDSNNHNYGAWSTTTVATCTQPEIQTRVCSRDVTHTETKTLSVNPTAHKDDDNDGICDYDPAHDLNTAPTLTLGSFNGVYFKEGDTITLTVSEATKGTGAPETWDTLTFTGTLAGKDGTVVATGAGVGTSKGSATISWVVSGMTDGQYAATVVVTDSRGLRATKTTSDKIIIDTTAPEAPSINAETNWVNRDVAVTITAGNADIAGLDKVTYVLTGATEKSETTGTSLTVVNEGETTITAYTWDKAGNKSEPATKTVRIEKIKPTVTFTEDGSNGEYAQSFSTVVTVEDLGAYVSGVDASSLKYVWTTSNTAPSESAIANAFASGDTITTPANVSDNHYLWILAKDNATNKTVIASKAFLVDNVKPTVVFTENENLTYEKLHTVIVTVRDEEGNINSGVDASSLKYMWTKSTTAPTAEDFANEGVAFTNDEGITTPAGETGIYYLWVIASDNVGNTIIAGSGEQRIDNNKPTIEFQFVGGNSVYSAINVVVKDEYEGVERSGVNEGSLNYTLSTMDEEYNETYVNNSDNTFPNGLEGQYKLEIEAEDNAGNAAKEETTVFIDTVAPVITYNPNGVSEFANEHTTVVTIKDKSMITSAKYVWTTSTVQPADSAFEGTFDTNKVSKTGVEVKTPEGATGDYYLWVMAVDQAGNKAVAVSEVFKLDNKVPTVEFSVNGSDDYEPEHTTRVTVTETALESGVNENTLKYVWTTSNEAPAKEEFTNSFVNGQEISTPADVEGTYYLWIYAEDNIGNTAIIGSDAFLVDDKDLTVEFDPFENKAYAQEHETKVTFTDEGSGVKADSLKYVWTTDDSEEAPSASAFVNSFTNGASVVTPEGVTGVYYLWVTGKDNVGNEVTARSGEFWLDNTELPITLTIMLKPGTPVTGGITGKGIHIAVDSDVKPFKEDSIKWLISDSTAKPQVSDFENAGENNADVFFEEGIEEPAYVWVMAEDENGIVHMQSIYMIIDTKAPEVEFDPNGNSDDLTVIATVVTVTDYSSIVERKYMWTDDPDMVPTKDDVETSFRSGDTVEAPAEDGDYYLWVYAEDVVENVALVRSEVFKIDHTAPAAPTIIGKENDDNGEEIPSGETTNQDVYVEITPGEDDRDEGVETNVTVTKDGVPYPVTPDEDGNITLTEDGEYVVTATTVDPAGNESDPATYEVTIDKTAPTLPEIEGNDAVTGTEIPNGGTTRRDVIVTITPADDAELTEVTITKDGEEIIITPNEDGTFTLTEEGTYVVTATSTDAAGNESEPATYEVTIDKTVQKPTIEAEETTGEQNPIENEGLTGEDAVVIPQPSNPEDTVEVTVTKDGEPITITPNPDGTYPLDEDGVYEFEVKEVDPDGNESEPEKFVVIVDKTAPAAPTIVGDGKDSGSRLPDGGTTKENVIVTITPGEDNRENAVVTIVDVKQVKDGTEVNIPANEDGTYTLEEDGTYVITARNEDELGNKSEEASYTITINNHAPNTPVIKPSEVPTEKPVPNDGETKEEVKVEIEHDEDDPDDEDGDGRKVTTDTVITNEDGEDVTDKYTNPEGEIVITESGEYDITTTTTDESVTDPNDKIEVSTTVHIIIDLDPPTVIDDEKETDQNTPVAGNLDPQDNFGVTELVISKEPEHGEVEIDEDGNYTYTPEEGYYGEDTFEVVAKDKVGNESEPAVVVIKVRKVLEEVDVVTAKEKEIVTYKNKAYTTKALPAVDKNGDDLAYEITEAATNGTITFDPATRKITYTPDKDYVGEDTFKLKASNEHEEVIITFHVTVKNKTTGGGSSSGTTKPVEETEEHIWYVRGYEDGTVRPNGTITREEIAMILYRLMTDSKENAKIKVKVSYLDVEKTRWSYDAIAYLTEKGILTGYEDGTFNPTAAISRAELAAILVRYQKITSKTVVSYEDVANGYWAKDAIEKVTTSGLMQGYEDGTFKPTNKLTRAEAVTVINRLLQRNAKGVKVNDNPFPDLAENHWAYSEMLEAITTHTCEVDKDNNYKETWKSHEYPYLEK